MTDRQEALDPLRRLRSRLQELADKLHVELNNVAFMPGPDPGDPDVVQVVFMLTPDALKTQAELEAKRIDDEFARIIAGNDIIDKAKESYDPDDLDLWDD